MTTKWPQVVLPVRNSTSAGEMNDNDVHNCEPNNITVQSKHFPKKIPVYTFGTLKIFVTPFLFALRHTFIGSASLLFLCPLPGRGENSTQDCHPCSFCSHKQRCATVVWALVPKIRTGGSFYLGAIFFVKFQINFTAEFRTNSSYGLLLQRFLWSFSGIFIISVKADTRKFQSKLSAFFFLLDAIFFKQ